MPRDFRLEKLVNLKEGKARSLVLRERAELAQLPAARVTVFGGAKRRWKLAHFRATLEAFLRIKSWNFAWPMNNPFLLFLELFAFYIYRFNQNKPSGA